ncbi:ETX/MTX2 family pore-forming toxin [Bacillus thuringiensis]|uniref:ETX/MTX2 family pore-forming toxin n=1 Tax=Bacillus thuringiensis serovar andalousiensis TaxID=257985 RepID=A0A6H0TNR5_BACTU|nr:ETX/MTX2 family pore-forming toxin [Bacillus thuringiensis]QIW21378.1 ETX/MTX2 family pore-forming toxin [Bacillus thuringiensis serovar andalousiensis]
MAITDIRSASEDYLRWHAQYYWGGATLQTMGFYPYLVQNPIAVPDQTVFEVVPVQKISAVQVLTNDSDQEQTQIVDFSEKIIETTTSTTTEGYKIGSGITSTSKFGYSLKILSTTTGFDQTFTLNTTSEYNHSSTETTTQTTERLWELTQPVRVAPRSQVISTLTVFGGKAEIPMTLNANLLGQGVSNGAPEVYSDLTLRKTDGSTWYNWVYASQMYDLAWTGKPVSFAGYTGHSLILKGAAVTTTGPCLYSTVRFDETPLPGYEKDSKPRSWYSNEVLLRDRTIITIPDLDPKTGRPLPPKGPEPILVSSRIND